jgi:arylsulfatase A-like enzyme
VWVLVAVLGGACSADPEPAPPPTPSRVEHEAGTIEAPGRPRLVVLVSLDTVRADHLGTYGYSRPTTPWLDALAEEGGVFEDVTSTSPWTLPAHASLLTGLYPDRHGASSSDRALREHVPTLAKILSSRGIRTMAIVNSVYVARLFDLDRGFEHFRYVPEIESRIGPSTFVTDLAIEALRDTDDERLFLFVHYYDPHSDYLALPRFHRRFVRPYEGEAEGTSAQLFLYTLDPDVYEACAADPEGPDCTDRVAMALELEADRVEYDEADRRHLIDLYDANLSQTDAEFQRLIEFMRFEGLLDEALVIVTSDHGEEFLEHGGVLHSRTQYQELLHVPLIVRGPGVPAGARIATPVSLVDVAPTVLAAMGLTVPDLMDGADLSGLWQRAGDGSDTAQTPPEPFAGRALYAGADYDESGDNRLHAVRRGRYKLIYDATTDEYALYDLVEDPGERTDASARAPEVAEDLRRHLEARMSSIAQGPIVTIPDRKRELLERLGYF